MADFLHKRRDFFSQISSLIVADRVQRKRYAHEYRRTEALDYQGQPDFAALAERIHQYIDAM